MGTHPDKHITKSLQKGGQQTGNPNDDKARTQLILTTLKTTLMKAHARLYAWHCTAKYGTQQKISTQAPSLT
jgi:hypothetical protein